MKLNLGCQIHYFDGWINIDLAKDDPNLKVDLYCDVSELPYEDNTIDFIYAGHLIEHFYPDTLPMVIKEWHRVLKPGSKLVVVTPDSGAVFRDYAAGKFGMEATWQQLYGRIYSYDRDSERHHIAFDNWMVRELTQKGAEWSNVEDLNFNNPPYEISPMIGNHISTGAYQLGLVLTK